MLNLMTTKENEKYLRQLSEDVDFSDPNLEKEVNELKEFLKENPIGYALASIQLGIPKKIICISSTQEDGVRDGDMLVLLNPKIISQKGRTEFWEACFSCGTSNMGLVERPYSITLEYCDIDGNKYNKTFEGFICTVLSHEIDHLYGIFHLDRAKDFISLEYEDRIAYRKEHPYKIYSKTCDFEYEEI